MEKIYTQWATGFASGIVVFGDVGNRLEGVDYNGFAFWLENYCRLHATERFALAVAAFIGSRQP